MRAKDEERFRARSKRLHFFLAHDAPQVVVTRAAVNLALTGHGGAIGLVLHVLWMALSESRLGFAWGDLVFFAHRYGMCRRGRCIHCELDAIEIEAQNEAWGQSLISEKGDQDGT